MPASDPVIPAPCRASVLLPRPFWIGVALVALFVCAVVCFVDVISARDMTVTAMGETSYRISMYAEKNGRLPAALSVIPARN